MEKQYKTRFPLVLIHGLGFRDWKRPSYWGRIPKALIALGASIYYGGQDSDGSIESNAAQIKRSVEDILQKTGAPKVNLIAHSKGGLDARYMVSVLGMRDKVASLTTIVTPHHGSKAMDVLLRLPKFLIRIAAFFANVIYMILGDENPDTETSFHQFSTSFAAGFNKSVPDCEGVYCQSFAFAMKNVFSDIYMALPYLAVKLFEGENDGLVTPASAAWANYRGVVKSVSGRGISHCDAVDMRRHRFSKKRAPGAVSDIVDFYADVVADLAERGF